MAHLVLTNASHSYADGFWIAAVGDSSIVLYTVAYYAICGFKHRLPKDPSPVG